MLQGVQIVFQNFPAYGILKYLPLRNFSNHLLGAEKERVTIYSMVTSYFSNHLVEVWWLDC